MEKFYFFSAISDWQADLDMEDGQVLITPSEKVLEAIIDYSQTQELYSPSLDETVRICLN